MGLCARWRGTAVVVAAAMSCSVLPWTAAGATVPDTRVVAEPTTSESTAPPSSPIEDEVLEAQAAAAAVAKQVADITSKVELAGARLLALQRGVAASVEAEERAREQLADADEGLRQANARLVTARDDRDDADRALSSTAADMYMQGGALHDLATLLLAPPALLSDLGVVLEHQAIDARETVDAATSAAADAASQERRLAAARASRASAVEAVVSSRADVEAQAALAGAEAATLGAQQETLTTQLARLEQGAADLVEQREAAARLAETGLIGVQAAGGPESGPGAAREIAGAMLAAYGWGSTEFSCLNQLWHGESGWSWSATNSSSGAYGIPQSLPGWKMASAGSDWLTNPATQIRWGLDYIDGRYGSPCEAHSQWLGRSPHWY